MIIKQGNDNLCRYTKRFMEAITEISDLEIDMTIHGFQMGLSHDSLLAINLNIQKVRALPKLLPIAKLYIEVKKG